MTLEVKSFQTERGDPRQLPESKAPVDAENTSGYQATGFLILLRPYEIAKVSKGGIVLVDETQERAMLQDQRAVVLDIGAAAWCDEPEARCQIGDRVLISRYAGQLITGLDGKKYRLVNDKDIGCRIVGKESEDG